MSGIIEYVFMGLLHYLNILFGLFDFKDLGIMWIILIGVFIICIFNKDVRKNIVGLIKPLINVVKTLPGMAFLILFLSYYIYILIFFEEKITFVVLVFSIYLCIKDYVKTNLNLLLESNTSIWDLIKEISISAILLCVQQMTIMFENNNIHNVKQVLFSLMIIPIFSIMFFVMKHYCIYKDFYTRYKKYISINEYIFFKIFNDCLIECGTYVKNEKVLSQFIIKNKNATYSQLRANFEQDIKIIILEESSNRSKIEIVKDKIKPSKMFKILNNVWLVNIFNVTMCVILKRFTNLTFDFWYYFSFIILIMYFWYDMMKVKKIENQFDYMMYAVIYLILIVILLIYNHSLNNMRLTELGFLIPIFLFFRIYTINKKFPNLLLLPFLSKNNFFGLNPNDYKKNNSISLDKDT